MSKKEFQKIFGQVYAIGIQYGQTEEQMLALAKQMKEELKVKWIKGEPDD